MDAISAELRPHPAGGCDAIRRFGVTLEAPLGHELRIRYRADGEIDRLRLPPTGTAVRRDGLWQHSCFEAFLRPDASKSYYEFNFSPSGEWAVYRFGRRRGDHSSPGMRAPAFLFMRHPDYCELTAYISIGALPELAGASVIRAGVAAVIEAGDGTLSYWALAHAGDKPDFHDPSTFSLRVSVR